MAIKNFTGDVYALPRKKSNGSITLKLKDSVLEKFPQGRMFIEEQGGGIVLTPCGLEYGSIKIHQLVDKGNNRRCYVDMVKSKVKGEYQGAYYLKETNFGTYFFDKTTKVDSDKPTEDKGFNADNFFNEVALMVEEQKNMQFEKIGKTITELNEEERESLWIKCEFKKLNSTLCSNLIQNIMKHRKEKEELRLYFKERFNEKSRSN